MHPCVPYALTFGKGMLLAAGADLKVVMYSANGRAVQTEDFSDQPGLREFTCMSAGPSGDIVTVGAFDAFITFKYSEGEARWKRLSTRQVRASPTYLQQAKRTPLRPRPRPNTLFLLVTCLCPKQAQFST